MKPRLFIDLLILDVINRFIFGHGILIYCLFNETNSVVNISSIAEMKFHSGLFMCLPNFVQLDRRTYQTVVFNSKVPDQTFGIRIKTPLFYLNFTDW